MTLHRRIAVAALLAATAMAPAWAAPPPAAPAKAAPDPARSALERTAAGMIAKVLCSDTFLSHRTSRDILENDLTWLPLLPSNVDEKARTVSVDTSSGPRSAVFREGLGCTLTYDRPLVGAALSPVRAASSGNAPAKVRIDKAIQTTLQRWMDDPHPDLMHRRGTRAVVVLRDGVIVGEAYGEGFNRDTPLPGYSMTKTVGMLVAGVLVGRGWLSVDTDHLFTAWSRANDVRQRITVDYLLRMESGLAWDEDYQHPDADVFAMLAAVPDAAAFAAGKPMREGEAPGRYWQYSSGSYAMLGSVMQRAIANHHRDALAFPRDALFNPLGMRSAVVEPDASGTPQWPAFMYATARDWAKLGQLMLQDGRWNGRRILPEGWVAYATRPTATATAVKVGYGAGVWLPTTETFGDALPAGAYYMRGFEEQYLFVIPSRHMVILRLGLTRPAENFDVRRFVGDVLNSGS